MNRLVSLTVVNLKSSLDAIKVSKKRSLNILFIGFLVVALIVPMFFLFQFLFHGALKSLHQINQEALLVNALVAGLTILIFFFSMLHIPYVYYFSNDLETYLALPLKPYEILLSKFFVILLYEYAIILMVFVPFILSFVQVTGQLMAIPFGIIIGLLLPIVPILLSSLVIILLMNFVPIFKNKNTINIVIGVITIVLAVGFNLLMNGNEISENMMMDLLMKGNNSISQVMFVFLPHVRFAANAIVNHSILNLILFIGITLGLLALYLMFAQVFYLNGATTISDAARSKKRFSDDQLSDAKKGSVLSSFAIREIKTLFRTPAYLLNGILPIFIFPILILIMPLIGSSRSGLDVSELVPVIQNFLYDSHMAFPITIIVGLVLGLIMSGATFLSITSFSREAKLLGHLKAYPINYFVMMLGKLFVNIGLTFISAILTVAVINFIMPLPIHTNAIVLVVSLVSILFANLMAMTIDLVRPNLKWTTEIQVIKQGLNPFINTIILWGIGGLFVFIFFMFQTSALVVALQLLAVLLILIIALGYYLKTRTQELVLRHEV